MSKTYGSISVRESQMDLCVKYAFGPQKLSATKTAEKIGISRHSVQRVLRAYTLVGNGETDALVEGVASSDLSINHVKWAYSYYGIEVPADFDSRVQAALRGTMFAEKKDKTEEKEQTEEKTSKEKTGQDNLVVLCDRINALGRAVSDGLTEKTASVLAKEIATAIKDSMAVATDLILAEMAKQTEHLEKIAYNTKKLKKG